MAAPDGYRVLIEAQTPALHRRALLLARDWYLAEDLVQETAVTALIKWRQVQAAEDPAAYLQTVLTNHFLSRTRKRSYQEAPTDTIEVPANVDPWPGLELELQVAQGMAVLNPNERAVIVGRYLDDRSAAEVAQQLGRTESWVRVTAHRALAKMRSELEGEPPPPPAKRSVETRVQVHRPARNPLPRRAVAGGELR